MSCQGQLHGFDIAKEEEHYWFLDKETNTWDACVDQSCPYARHNSLKKTRTFPDFTLIPIFDGERQFPPNFPKDSSPVEVAQQLTEKESLSEASTPHNYLNILLHDSPIPPSPDHTPSPSSRPPSHLPSPSFSTPQSTSPPISIASSSTPTPNQSPGSSPPGSRSPSPSPPPTRPGSAMSQSERGRLEDFMGDRKLATIFVSHFNNYLRLNKKVYTDEEDKVALFFNACKGEIAGKWAKARMDEIDEDTAANKTPIRWSTIGDVITAFKKEYKTVDPVTEACNALEALCMAGEYALALQGNWGYS
jgi:hypothetical protein